MAKDTVLRIPATLSAEVERVAVANGKKPGDIWRSAIRVILLYYKQAELTEKASGSRPWIIIRGHDVDDMEFTVD